MDDGVVLLDSAAILEVLDDMVGPGRAMTARTGPDRREGLRVCALAGGAADKAVSLVYERALRETALPFWVDRCRAQILDTLAMLNRDRAVRPGSWWFGEAISHADIMLGCLLRFIGEALPEQFDHSAFPALVAHSAACEALPVFQAVQQPFRIAKG
jgi:glutathione S-transferase